METNTEIEKLNSYNEFEDHMYEGYVAEPNLIGLLKIQDRDYLDGGLTDEDVVLFNNTGHEKISEWVDMLVIANDLV